MQALKRVYSFVILCCAIGLCTIPNKVFAQDTAKTEASESQADDNSPLFSDDYPRCRDNTAVVHEVTPYLGFNDFNGVSQTVGAIGYSRSQCIGTSNNRWQVEVNAAHVGEQTYKADAVIVGLGLAYHPSADAPGLVVVPIVRAGYERVHNGPETQVLGAALTVENIFTLGRTERFNRDGKTIAIPATQMMIAGRVEYSNRRSNFAGAPFGGALEQTTFFGMIGLDGNIGKSRWRWQTTASYQTLDSPWMDGYASFSLSARPLNADYDNYRVNFQVTGNFGDRGYRGILFSVSFRFSESRKLSKQ